MSRRCRHTSPSSISTATTLVASPPSHSTAQRRPKLPRTPKTPKPPNPYTTLKPSDAGYAIKRGRRVHRPGVVVIKSFDEDGHVAGVQEIELASQGLKSEGKKEEAAVVKRHDSVGEDVNARMSEKPGLEETGKRDDDDAPMPAVAPPQRRWSWDWMPWCAGDKNK